MSPNHLPSLVMPATRPFPLVAIICAFLLVACSQPGSQPGQTVEELTDEQPKVIVTRVVRQTVQVPATIAAPADPSPVELDISQTGTFVSLDPQLAEDDNSLDLIENLFVGLTRYNHQTGAVEPALAESWRVSNDGRTWTFNLREDIFWVRTAPEGSLLGNSQPEVTAVRPVVADDVVFAIQRVCDPRVATPDVFIFFIISGCQEVHDLTDPQPEDLARISARAMSDSTLTLRLTEAAGYFETMTSHWLLKPVPAELVEEMGGDWAERESIWTNGPFVIGPGTVSGRRTVLFRNPFWQIPFGGNVDRVNLVHLDSASDAYELWEQRELDLSPVPADQLEDAMRRYRLKLTQVPDQSVFYLAYNFESRAFATPEVRRAFGWAIDRMRLIEEVYGSQAIPVRHLAPPGTAGAPPEEVVGMGYNPDRARQQMAASSFTDCRLLPPIRYMVSSSDRALQQAELLRDMWMEELGCQADLITVEQVQFGELLAKTRPEAGRDRPDLWDLGWAPYFPDEHNWLHDVLHCVNSENRPLRPCSQVDELLVQAGRTVGLDQRAELYRQVEQQFFGEQGLEPVSPLFGRAQPTVLQSWLSYTPALFGGEQFDTYVVEADVKALERLR